MELDQIRSGLRADRLEQLRLVVDEHQRAVLAGPHSEIPVHRCLPGKICEDDDAKRERVRRPRPVFRATVSHGLSIQSGQVLVIERDMGGGHVQPQVSN